MDQWVVSMLLMLFASTFSICAEAVPTRNEMFEMAK
jgi:hypothetical protein